MQVHRCNFVPWKPSGVLCIQFSPSRALLALCRADGSLELWRKQPSLALARVIPPLSTTPEAVRRCVWASDTVFFTAGWTKQITQWSVTSLQPMSVTNSFGGAVWDLAVSPDGRTLVAACEDGTLRVFDVTSDGLAYVRAVASCEARVLCCSFHPSKPLVALGDARGRMEVWDLATGAQLCRVKVSGGRVEAAVEAICYLAEDTVVTGDFIGYTQFWDVRTQTLLSSYHTHTACIQSIIAGPDQTLFVAGMDPKVVRFLKYPGTDTWSPSLSSFSHEHPVNGLDYAGTTLVSCSIDGSLHLYGLQTFSQKPAAQLRPHMSSRAMVSVSGAASRVLCCRLVHSVQLWQLGKAAGAPKQVHRTGERLQLAKAHKPLIEIHPDLLLPLDYAEISHNGELVVLGTREGLRAYTVEQGPKNAVEVTSKELPDELAAMRAVSVALSPCDSWLAVADYDGVVHTYSLPDFSPRARITAHRGRYVWRLALRDGKVMSADDASVVAVHHAHSGAPVCTLPAFEVPLCAADFHATEPWLLLASLSNRIYVYDHSKLQHTPWSAHVGDRLVSAQQGKRRTVIRGFACTPTRLIFWGAHFVSALDLHDSTWEEDAGRKKSKKERVQHIPGYHDVLCVAALSDAELVVVERPWKQVLAEMEAPVYKHRYVM